MSKTIYGVQLINRRMHGFINIEFEDIRERKAFLELMNRGQMNASMTLFTRNKEE